MKTETDTPKTDALHNAFVEDDSTGILNGSTIEHYCDMAEHARELEREVARLQAELAHHPTA